MTSPIPAPPPSLYPAQWQLALDALTAVVQQGRVADRLLQHAFRERRQMGGRDRALVRELIYGVLRDLRRLRRMAASDAPADWLAVYALQHGLVDADRLARLGVAGADALSDVVRRFDDSTLTAAERLNVPDGILATWSEVLGSAGAQQLAATLTTQAPVDLRVNTLRATREQARAALSSLGVDAQPTPLSPVGLRLGQRASLQSLAPFREGWIELQDEGSQLLALLVEARPGERIADFCAGAGGKTLALAARMQDRGELLAMDADARRLGELRPRLKRAGVHCVREQALDGSDDVPESLQACFDAVLVDAPCSGSGTWRRQPEARLRPLDLAALAQVQNRILERAATLVRPGGRLVYATCSLLPAENQAVVEHFLAAHAGFELQDAGAALARAAVDLPGRFLQLYPHRHGTDGFFGACLRRTSTPVGS